jgi:hypothetical protein
MVPVDGTNTKHTCRKERYMRKLQVCACYIAPGSLAEGHVACSRMQQHTLVKGCFTGMTAAQHERTAPVCIALTNSSALLLTRTIRHTRQST